MVPSRPALCTNRMILGVAIVALVIWIAGCASPPAMVDELTPSAVQAAQRRGASELDCSTATSAVIHQEMPEEPQSARWYAPAARAHYTIATSGCGKEAMYRVTCDERSRQCIALDIQIASAAPQSRRALVDEMRSEALAASERRGSSELACSTATARVLDESTIREPQTGGWRVRYTVAVAGCGKEAAYSISCSERAQTCYSSEAESASDSPPTHE